MLTRLSVLVISILNIQNGSGQQNGSNSVSNFILNSSLGSQTQGSNNNILQKTLNQFSGNRMLPINLQNSLNSQQNLNLQSLNSQQALNLQTLNTQSSNNLNSQQALNLQQTNGQPSISKPTSSFQQPLLLQQNTNTQNANNLQANLNIQQNPSLGSGQVIQQFSPGLASPTNAQLNTYASSQTTLTPSMLNHGSITTSIACPQHLQIPSTSSYIIDGAAAGNAIDLPIGSGTALTNHPSLLTVLAVPQQSQTLEPAQPLVATVQNPDLSNQVTIIRSVQPQSSAIPLQLQPSCSEQALLQGTINHPPAAIYTAVLPTASSILPKFDTKSSSLKTLLPLILNLLKERNSCGCHHHCGCKNNTRNGFNGDDIHGGYSKQNSYCERQDVSSKYSNDISEEVYEHRRPNRRGGKRYGKYKDYSEEAFYEDYDLDYKDELNDKYIN